MNDGWWPDMLRHIPAEDPWGGELVTVAEIAGFDDPSTPGQRAMWSSLVTPADLALLDGDLRAFGHEVESTGRPGPDAAGGLEPGFRVSAYKDGRRIDCEPLVLGWTNANRTALALDPRFAMTYGLMPRALADGSIRWDDPAAPEFDVAIVDRPSVYQDLRVSGAMARVSRAHLQDYLTLRGMHLVQVYYQYRTAIRDEAAEAALAGRDRGCARFRDREFDISRNRDGSVTAQVWGARVVAGPGAMPITVDDLDRTGLEWPGVAGPVTHEVARRMRPWDQVLVADAVLGAYEGRPGFRVNPESGGVSFEGQWSVGHCRRVGRDLIQVELKKLYEGTPNRVIRHWHAHAVAPRPELREAGATAARNIAVRSREIVGLLVEIGERLASLNHALRLQDRPGSDFVGLDRRQLEHVGWWNEPFVEPVARHAASGMTRDDLLDRCMDLDKLAIEALGEKLLRPLVRAIGDPEDDIDGFRGLKLLDRIACLAQVANAGGLSLSRSGREVVARLHRDGTDPERPLTRLFVVADLRQLKGHRKQDVDAGVERVLARLGVDARAAAGGWGAVLDEIYDGVVSDLAALNRTLSQVLENVEAR